MDPKQRLLAYLARHGPATGPELARALGVTRQAVNRHLRGLAETGGLVRTGVTRGARYSLPAQAPAAASLTRTIDLEGLEEEAVWDQFATRLNLRTALRANVGTIVHYAFTEILNNAIEHSGSKRCRISVRLGPGHLAFDVRDSGIGVFHSIASTLHLENEHAALLELLKGRITTMPEAHTGEGLFFTSRAADRFVLESHRIRVEWSRAMDDVFVSDVRHVAGTAARFEIQRSARQRLAEIFNEYAPEAYDFELATTRVLVRLLRKDCISRSEARRLLANPEKFREIRLDFRGVRSIGQAFADEIFRVHARRHPDVVFQVENASPAVASMIRHVAATSEGIAGL